MKNTNLLFLILIILFTACQTQNENIEESTLTNNTHPYSSNFLPSVLEEDKRVEKIKEIAPEIHRLIEEHSKARHIPGIAYGVVVDDQLILSDATGVLDIDQKNPATTQSAFRIASMSKSFTAMAIIKLRDEGKLSLADPVEKYIPEMANLEYLTSDAPVIDIENLLTMTAGFPEDNPWGDRQLDETNEMLMDLMAGGVSFSNVASFGYEYSNTGYALLGNIISRVSGKPYQEYIRESIFQPLGMENTYWEYDNVPEGALAIGYRWEDDQWKLEPMLHDGSFGCMGGLITSIEDFSEYVSLHLSAWPPRSESDNGPIKRSSLREMHTSQFTRLYANARDWNGETCATMTGYGYGLRVSTNCKGINLVAHGGALPGFGSNYVFYPEYGVGLMAFGNLTYTSPWPLSALEKLLFETTGLEERQLPVSDILKERTTQVAQLVQDWDETLANQIVAENFFLDKSLDHRLERINQVLSQAGAIERVTKIEPYNQLRGRFKMKAENGDINVFFTLTPEKEPKVQRLDVSFVANEVQ
ncbi:MAG: serine hydrolase domain-containing protein [Bacteroidota bacterium]